MVWQKGSREDLVFMEGCAGGTQWLFQSLPTVAV